MNSRNLPAKRKPNCTPSSQEAEGPEGLTALSLTGQLQAAWPRGRSRLAPMTEGRWRQLTPPVQVPRGDREQRWPARKYEKPK